MDIELLITERFNYLMSCPHGDVNWNANGFNTRVHGLRTMVEAGDPFCASSYRYSPQEVAVRGHVLSEFCDDAPTHLIEALIKEQLDKRGLSSMTISEGTEAYAIVAGTYTICGKKVVLENELLPCDEFLGHPIYRHNGMTFTIEMVQQEDAPVNNVGGGNIAGVSPGQEPPGRRGLFFRRNLKKTEKLKRDLKKRF